MIKVALSELMKLAVAGSPAGLILLKATVTTVLAFVALQLARRSRASVRHALLAASFAVLLVLPIYSTFAPSVRVTVPIFAHQETVQHSFAVVAPRALATRMPGDSVFVPSQVQKSSGLSLSTLLSAIWMTGTVLFLLPVVAGLWQARSLRRSGIRWHEGKSIADCLALEAGIRSGVDVLLHESVPGPMTCGALRPTIMLPIDAQNWPEEELKRAIVHELEHVRRSDWISRCLARIVCAGYWFHPFVWTAWRQFVLEAERACDDAVLRRAEATAYANQLVVLAQRLLTEPSQPMLAMASRNDLAKRVAAMLDTRQRRGRAGVAWIGLACAVSTLLVMIISPLYIVARIQSPAAPTDGRKFEVASVRPCRDEDFRTGDQRRQETTFSPGRITVNCIPLARIIYFAYAGIGSMDNPLVNDSPGDPTHVRGAADWIRTETFYIEARAEGLTERGVMMGPMLRALLEERFKLKTHRELEQVPMYAMTVAKGGLRIKPIGPDGCLSAQTAQNLSREENLAAAMSDKPVCGAFTSLGNQFKRNWALGGTTLSRFANQILSTVLDRHVMDNSGVDGLFNIKLEFGYDDSIRPGVFGGRPNGPLAELPADVEPAPSIFTAIEQQLGLKLEKATGPRGFVVIDSAERPSGR